MSMERFFHAGGNLVFSLLTNFSKTEIVYGIKVRVNSRTIINLSLPSGEPLFPDSFYDNIADEMAELNRSQLNCLGDLLPYDYHISDIPELIKEIKNGEWQTVNSWDELGKTIFEMKYLLDSLWKFNAMYDDIDECMGWWKYGEKNKSYFKKVIAKNDDLIYFKQ